MRRSPDVSVMSALGDLDFVAVIPLKARSNSTNWSHTLECLAETIDSVPPSMRVMIATSDADELRDLLPPRVELHGVTNELDFSLHNPWRQDYFFKRCVLLQALYSAPRTNPIYAVFLDADDILSPRFQEVIAEKLKSVRRGRHLVFSHGIIADLSDQKFVHTKGFPSHCGSSFAAFIDSGPATRDYACNEITEFYDSVKTLRGQLRRWNSALFIRQPVVAYRKNNLDSVTDVRRKHFKDKMKSNSTTGQRVLKNFERVFRRLVLDRKIEVGVAAEWFPSFLNSSH